LLAVLAPDDSAFAAFWALEFHKVFAYLNITASASFHQKNLFKNQIQQLIKN